MVLAPSGVIPATALLILLVVASVSDWRTRRIPNSLVLLTAALGIASTALFAGVGRVPVALLGIVLGLVLWLPFYAFGMLGAGDVKLFAAAGAWLTPWQVVNAAILSAFAGGVFSLAWLVAELGVGQATTRLWMLVSHLGALRPTAASREGRRSLPYGIAMSVGIGLTLFGFSIVNR